MTLISNTQASKRIVIDHTKLDADKLHLIAGKGENNDIDFGANSKVSK